MNLSSTHQDGSDKSKDYFTDKGAMKECSKKDRSRGKTQERLRTSRDTAAGVSQLNVQRGCSCSFFAVPGHSEVPAPLEAPLNPSWYSHD